MHCSVAPAPEENDGNGTEQVGCRQSRKGHKVLMKQFGHYLIEKKAFPTCGTGTIKLSVTNVQPFGIIFVPYFSAQCSINFQTLLICPV